MSKQTILTVMTLMVITVLLLGGNIHAGSGTYTDGTPDRLTLNVNFEFDVSPNFNPNTNWENTLSRASALLYNSTDGQLQIRTVNFYNNCPEISPRADLVIKSGSGGASAHVDGLGRNGQHVLVYNDTHTRNEPAARGHFGIVHELGHYVFGLYDEYKNSADDPSSCISPDSTIASIMDGGTTVQPNNQRTEWALPADEDSCRDTVQFERRGMVDWPWIVQHIADRHGATLTTPTAYNTAMPAGHEALTFNYFECKVRSVVSLDRSGSMAGSKLETAKEGGRLFIDLIKVSDELGVSSFSTDASVNYDINVMTDANKAAAKSAINSLTAEGATNIGGGLQTSLNMITGKGTPVSNEVVVLLSDGMHNTGTDPSSVIPALKSRGVAVYTIGLGADVDAALLSNIAKETGGNYFFAASRAGLPAHFNSIIAQLRNDGLITALREDIASGETNNHTVPVDTYTQAGGEATFVLSWASGDLSLILMRPDGTIVNNGDFDVALHIKDSLSEIFRMSNPFAGDWTTGIVSNGTDTTYNLQVNSTAKSHVSVTASTDKGNYGPNEPILIQTSVLAPPSGGLEAEQVIGASVKGTVSLNETMLSHVTLYDDGADSHGDAEAHDGVYSNLFRPTHEGNYTFEITVDNQSGVTAIPEEDPSKIPQPVDPFQRKTQVTVFAQAPTVLSVAIDIWPFIATNVIVLSRDNVTQVAILSTSTFDAPNTLDKTSVTFGRTGNERSLDDCDIAPLDVNGDRLLDQLCNFNTRHTGFQRGDTEGILKGKTVNGVPIEGHDSVRIIP